VTSTQAILARKRSGKSYTASVQAEELLRHKQQIAAIDPTGAWWGLRSSAAGDGPGFPVVVFGGDHADVPLEPHAGRMLARALVDHAFSAIFDVGLMVTDDQIRFTSDFASELLRINRTALHLYIDEADTFAPQSVESKSQKLCLGTVSRLVKQGGIRGVGVTMIAQRPARYQQKGPQSSGHSDGVAHEPFTGHCGGNRLDQERGQPRVRA
jgi:DNA helicase HerA-like ATPase